MKTKKQISVFIFIMVLTAVLFSVKGFCVNGENVTASEAEEALVCAPTGFEVASRTENSLTLRWEASENALLYKIQIKNGDKYITAGSTDSNSFVIEKLKSGKTYLLRIRAYAGENKSSFVYLKACTKPGKVTLKSAEFINGRITVKWKKKNVSGYQLQYSPDSDFSSKASKRIEGGESCAYKTKRLEADKTYYFRLRAYCVCEGKNYYSKWTKFSVKTTANSLTSKGYIIEQKDGITYVDGVMIVNKSYSIPKSYAPGALTKQCSEAFNKMRSAAAKEGINLYIVSGYRSYETQKRLYNNYAAKDGKSLADTYSARPGSSEHQTGLAMDLNSLKSSFGETKEGKWLAANCHKYGFIIRYPKGKQGVTGYIYEPWHVRYLGKAKAKAIYKSGLCLEEYYGITSKYSS